MMEQFQKSEFGEQERIKSFIEENEKLKKQMFTIDKQYRNMEAALADEQDSTLRVKKEVDLYRKRLQEANQEKTAAFESLEQYQQIFAKCEQSLKQLQDEKALAIRERDEAIKETATVRHRYRNIIGAETFDIDD